MKTNRAIKAALRAQIACMHEAVDRPDTDDLGVTKAALSAIYRDLRRVFHDANAGKYPREDGEP